MSLHSKYGDVEQWKDIPGFEGLYQASSWGRIKGLDRTVPRPNKGKRITYHERIMSAGKNEKGYWRLTLSKDSKRKTFRLSRLIALTWVPNPENLPEVNHDNLDKDNNHYLNLSWSTRISNMQHAFKNRKIKRYKNETHPKSKAVKQYDLQGNLINTFPSVNEAGRQGYDFTRVARVCRGERKTYSGFKWEYAA